MSSHPVVHIEISAKDPDAARKFYAEVFDWKTSIDQQMDYAMFSVEGGPGGGFPRIDGQMYKPGDVVVYIDCDDIDSTLQKIESLGGKRLLGKTEIPGMGWFAFFADPTGNRMALYTAMPM